MYIYELSLSFFFFFLFFDKNVRALSYFHTFFLDIQLYVYWWSLVRTKKHTNTFSNNVKPSFHLFQKIPNSFWWRRLILLLHTILHCLLLWLLPHCFCTFGFIITMDICKLMMIAWCLERHLKGKWSSSFYIWCVREREMRRTSLMYCFGTLERNKPETKATCVKCDRVVSHYGRLKLFDELFCCLLPFQKFIIGGGFIHFDWWCYIRFCGPSKSDLDLFFKSLWFTLLLNKQIKEPIWRDLIRIVFSSSSD